MTLILILATILSSALGISEHAKRKHTEKILTATVEACGESWLKEPQ